MTPHEAATSPDLLAELIAAGPAVRTLALSMIVEMDRQQLARRNPTLAAMMEAVPDKLMADIVNDQRRGIPPPSSLAAAPNAPEPPRGSGTYTPAPLGPPPGQRWIDAMLDEADAKDRVQRIVDAAITERSKR
jgi:hypothetical protein